MLDEPLGGEPPKRFAHRAAADGEAGGEVAFDEPDTRREPSGQNVLAKSARR